MKLGLSIFILVLSTVCIFSQGKLTGNVVSNDDTPLEYATITLTDLKDSLIQGTISNQKGDFVFENIDTGTYIILMNFIGFKEWQETVIFDESQNKMKVDKVTMIPNDRILDAVTITSEKSQYVSRMDKKIFNVGNDILSQGGDAISVLEQVPQVSVSPTGAVELRGSSAVQILINGRRSGLAASNALDQIDVSNISKIEVITNPSAAFDASGTAGIINIVLKKAKGEGWRGQLRAEYGVPADHVLLPSVSYKGDNLQVWGNVRWRYSDYNGRYSVLQRNTNTSSKFTLQNTEIENRHDDGLGYYFGADYNISENTNSTIAFYKSSTKDVDDNLLEYSFISGDNDEKFDRTGNSLENRSYSQLEVGLKHKLDDKGRKIDTYFQYDFWDSDKTWDLSTEGDVPSDIAADVRTSNFAGSDDIAIQSDFTYPMDIGKLQVGAKYEDRTVTNEYIAETLADDIWNTYQGIDNDIAYKEQIAAGYFTWEGELSSWEYKAGIRAENSSIKIEDKEGIFDDRKEYINFFPSVFLSKSLSESTSFQLSFSQRINRPSLWNLYPFNELTDVNIIRSGNPALDPAYTNGYEMSLSSRFEKFSINPGVYYRRTSDAFENYIEQGEDNYFETKMVNIDRFDRLGLEFSMRYEPIDALTFRADMNWEKFDQAGYYNGQDMSAEGINWMSRVSMNSDLGPLQFTTRFTYFGPRKNAQIDEKASYDVTAGINTSLFGDKLDVGIWVRNILDSRVIKRVSQTSQYFLEQSSRRTGARASINLSYKFNYGKRDRLRSASRGNR